MNENADKEQEIDKALRPLSFDDFIGQDSIVKNLKVFVEACNQREDALDHTLFHGPPGLGKTTLAHILANELKLNFLQHSIALSITFMRLPLKTFTFSERANSSILSSFFSKLVATTIVNSFPIFFARSKT